MRLALYLPEIPQNVGTLMRFCACMGIPLDIIEPCGFVFSDKKLLRAGMDYMDRVTLKRHSSWDAFLQNMPKKRLVATTPHTHTKYHEFEFSSQDVILMGPEGEGLPDSILEACQKHVAIPQQPETRSLNVSLAASIITSEALRQLGELPS